jgi:prophage DNA circulation protein
MATLAERLRPASFRKIPFFIDNAEFETGRRTQVHEYPQRDNPYSQDMGRKTREIEFDAFVIGVDYIEKANALLGAIEEYGPGQLVHPWFGTLKVNVLNCRVIFDRGLGLARFSLNFVESGELAFPSSSQSTAAASRAAAANLEQKSVGFFTKIATFGNQLKAIAGKVTAIAAKISSVIAQGLTIYGKALQFMSNPVFGLSSLLGFSTLPGNVGSLLALFNSPVNLGWGYAGLINLSTFGKNWQGDDTSLIPIVRGLTRMSTHPTLATPDVPAYVTATDAQIYSNTAAILSNTRQLLLVQAVGLSSYLNCNIYDDTQALKIELAAAIDTEILQVTDDDLYQALLDARSAMWQDLTERSRDSARLTTITPPDVLPALAIAYDFYEDAGRDLEIVARNKISNPGFIPVVPLQVLSR